MFATWSPGRCCCWVPAPVARVRPRCCVTRQYRSPSVSALAVQGAPKFSVAGDSRPVWRQSLLLCMCHIDWTPYFFRLSIVFWNASILKSYSLLAFSSLLLCSSLVTFVILGAFFIGSVVSFSSFCISPSRIGLSQPCLSHHLALRLGRHQSPVSTLSK